MATPRPPSQRLRDDGPERPPSSPPERPRPWWRTWVIAGVGIAVALLAIGAATVAGDRPQENNNSTPPNSVTTLIPTVPPNRAAAFIRALDDIAPGLASERADSVTNARNTCDFILEGSTNLIEATKTRFIGDGVDSMSDAQAQRIVDLIRSEAWCQ